MMKMVKQTAGRDQLGEFAPKFAELNDDILFGEVWSREDKLSLRDRSLITVVALMSKGILDSSLKSHLINAKKTGITKEEMAEIIRGTREVIVKSSINTSKVNTIPAIGALKIPAMAPAAPHPIMRVITL